MLGENLGMVKGVQKVGNDVLFLSMEEENKIDVSNAIFANIRYGVKILNCNTKLKLLKPSMLYMSHQMLLPLKFVTRNFLFFRVKFVLSLLILILVQLLHIKYT